MTQSGNTGSVEYAVDPSVYDSEYESLDPSLTESILSKLGENSADIKLLSLKFKDYYTIEEVDGLILDTQEFTYDRDTIDNKDAAVLQEAKDYTYDKQVIDDKDANTLQEAKDYTYSQVEIDNKDTAIMNKANNLEDANMLKDVVYNNVNGVLTFTKYDDTTKEIDLPLEYLVESGYYDEVANELVLVLANGSEIRIPVGNLLTDLDAHNIRFNGSGTNYLVNKNDVESAVKEIDTRVKVNADDVALKVNTNDIVNDLVSTDTNKPLSANQGKVLNDTTAKLAESNVFTQPQQVPNATLPQHTTNLSQVETMFEMFKQQLRGYNFAMPDLTGKEYLGNGEYFLSSTRNIDTYYNVFDGVFHFKSESSLEVLGSTKLISLQDLESGEYTFTLEYLSFGNGFVPTGTITLQDDLGEIVSFSKGSSNKHTININLNRDTQGLYFRNYIPSNQIVDIRLKLQLEKGDTATPYTVPGQIPQYKIVGEE